MPAKASVTTRSALRSRLDAVRPVFLMLSPRS
jgi:hypothetical protein